MEKYIRLQNFVSIDLEKKVSFGDAISTERARYDLL